ncbi:organic cation/carnitine transporter 2-like isoform X6 [Mobula hypostoma]|uniref:organic cation/carnitine transporter 2-like isoform X6 n=1 Tax=Mobula hypostoma TaxID=723540 RepID=UPI002FC2A5A2
MCGREYSDCITVWYGGSNAQDWKEWKKVVDAVSSININIIKASSKHSAPRREHLSIQNLVKVLHRTELLGKAERTAYSTLGVCMFYAIGYIILPLFAFYIREWRMLLLALTIPEVLYIPFWWLIPESPRWLITQGRVNEAEKIVQGFAAKNGIRNVGVIFQVTDSREYTLLNTSNNQKHPHSFLDLVKTSSIRNVTILSFLVWMITSTGYFVLTLGTPNMYGDPYLNCLISAFSEIVAYTIAWWMTHNAPRRLSTSLTLLLGGAVLLAVQFIPSSLHYFAGALVMIGKTGITICFSIIYVFSAELYPTVVRNMGIGVCTMASRIGSIISPYFVYLGVYDRMLPFMLMGALILLAGSFCLLLPETREQPLPETVNQVPPQHSCFGDLTVIQHYPRLDRMVLCLNTFAILLSCHFNSEEGKRKSPEQCCRLIDKATTSPMFWANAYGRIFQIQNFQLKTL